jgi:hypothetical protein
MYNFFKPKPGRFGVAPSNLTVRPVLGTLAAGTVVHNLGTIPARAYINRITISAGTFPNADSVEATLRKKPVGATAVALTGAIDIDNKTAGTGVAGAFLTAATEAQRTLNPGETLELSVVTVGTVTAQAADLLVTVELLVLE